MKNTKNKTINTSMVINNSLLLHRLTINANKTKPTIKYIANIVLHTLINNYVMTRFSSSSSALSSSVLYIKGPG
uniref:ORF91 n=1 Tax=Pieris brassicae granulosis virus TaxID=10465 RepID=A0A7G9U8N1_GVPB|nr:ORF91 [Pieris brassicae granulovirus]